MFNIKKKNLLLIAGFIWCIAGINVLRIGILSYIKIEQNIYTYFLSVAIFLIFGTMFYKISHKHTQRILNYDDYMPFWNFFDLKSYIIMVVMMGGGIGLRSIGILPDFFVAFFYSGLGLALALAGIVFIKNFINHKNIKL